MNFMDYILLVFFTITTKIPSQVFLFSTNHKYIYSSILLFSFLLLNIILYNIIYKFLKLDRSFVSFVFFFLFLLIVLLYVRSLYYLILNYNHMVPIQINNLSIYSKYKYLFYSTITIIFCFLWGLSFYFKSLNHFINFLTYPYIKEEVRRILYTWNVSFMGYFCIFIYKNILASSFFCKMFFMLHFLLFYFMRFVIACLLINFVFFNGDLCFLFYMLPFSFLCWILSFVDFYFKIFREGTTNYILEVLDVQYNGKINSLDYYNGFVKSNLNEYSFKLTSSAQKEGFSADDVNHLVGLWYDSSIIDLKFNRYYFYLKFFSFIIISLVCFCWFQISYLFLFSSLENTLVPLWFLMPFLRRSPLKSLQITRSPRELLYAKEGKPMNDIKVATKGAVSPGHPMVGDTKGSYVLVEAGASHGQPNGYESVKLCDNGITGIPPDDQKIFIIKIPGGPVTIPTKNFHLPKTKDSQDFFEKPDNKKTMDDLYKGSKKDDDL